MDSNLVDSARESRNSGATLKLRLAHLRSRYPHDIIYIVEGQDDYGPYDVWLTQLNLRDECSILSGKGKGQLIDLRRRLRFDKTGLRNGTYFIVDHDYDGLKGDRLGQDIYVTDSYSVENTLINEGVVRGIILDEFRLSDDIDAVDRIVDNYINAQNQNVNALEEINFRIYARAKLSIGNGPIENKISKIVTINLDSVSQRYSFIELCNFVPLYREPTAEEVSILKIDFDKLDPHKDYRGKHLMAFLKAWLAVAADARKNGTHSLPALPSLSFDEAKLNMRSLASRCRPPDKFKKFVELATITI